MTAAHCQVEALADLAETGACQYCRSLGIPCEADPKSRKRPFYRVSGEVYEHSIKLLRRFVPEEALPELTVEKIQALLGKLDSGASDASATPAPSAQLTGDEQGPAGSDGIDAGQQPRLRDLDSGLSHASKTPARPATALPPSDNESGSRHSGPAVIADQQPQLHPSKTPAAEAGLDPPAGSPDVMEADEHPLLQEELGCLLLDSMGKYRSSLVSFLSGRD